MLRKYIGILRVHIRNALKDFLIILSVVSAFAMVNVIVLFTTGLYILGILMLSVFSLVFSPVLTFAIIKIHRWHKKRGT